MAKKLMFPKGFYWGAATSAHQVEGGVRNDWSEWEKENAGRLAREAKDYWQPWQVEKFPEMLKKKNYISGKAADHYNRYEKDFDIAKSLGHNAHRFSIEWSRIEPKEGEFDEKEIEHYRKVIAALRGRGIEPFITLWHWTNPVWIRDIGGWENKKTVDHFIRYVEKITSSLEGVKFWMPINEPGTYVGMSYVMGNFPPQVRSLFRANRVFKNLMSAYRLAHNNIHINHDDAAVGMSHYAIYMVPYRDLPWNRALVKVLDYIRNWRFFESIRGSIDFVGLQYYHVDFIRLKLGKGRWGPIGIKNPHEWVNDMGWDIYPEGIYHLLRRAARYKKPIYITENGVADAKDIHRERFIKEHLRWVHKAIDKGVDVRGYFYWSLLDNFEWDKGFWPRFGLVEVNYEDDLKRVVRGSAKEYTKIIRGNSL